MEQLRAAQGIAPVFSVQNMFNLANRSAEPLLDYAAGHDIAFIPWFPLATGARAGPGQPTSPAGRRARRVCVAAGAGRAAEALARRAADPGHRHLEDNIARAADDLNAITG